MYPCDYFDEEISLDDNKQKVVDDFHKLYFKKLEQRRGLKFFTLNPRYQFILVSAIYKEIQLTQI